MSNRRGSSSSTNVKDLKWTEEENKLLLEHRNRQPPATYNDLAASGAFANRSAQAIQKHCRKLLENQPLPFDIDDAGLKKDAYRYYMKQRANIWAGMKDYLEDQYEDVTLTIPQVEKFMTNLLNSQKSSH